jgi:hypothetical protein
VYICAYATAYVTLAYCCYATKHATLQSHMLQDTTSYYCCYTLRLLLLLLLLVLHAVLNTQHSGAVQQLPCSVHRNNTTSHNYSHLLLCSHYYCYCYCYCYCCCSYVLVAAGRRAASAATCSARPPSRLTPCAPIALLSCAVKALAAPGCALLELTDLRTLHSICRVFCTCTPARV